MTDADVAAAISNHVRAFNDRDIDALMSGFTDDACWITGSSVARGRAELTELFHVGRERVENALRTRDTVDEQTIGDHMASPEGLTERF